jgi:hypothetical protein
MEAISAMPICEADPWRLQYFEGIPCPDDVRVPTEDGDAWKWFPRYKWVYNKLSVAESQGLECGPHGIEPSSFPVFSKPIFNMRGMGTGSRIFRTLKDYRARQRPGHIWMPLFDGEHVSTDVAVVDGEARWWRHAIGKALTGGTFDYWTVLAADRPEIEGYCADWLKKNLRGYTGMLNFETIGARIIEIHLRFADQWPDLYGGRPWVQALIGLYRDGTWNYSDGGRKQGYSVVLFGAHDLQYRHPSRVLVDDVRAMPDVTSVQITFHEDRPPSWHAMPPGGFRLAIINTWNLETGMQARAQLKASFDSQPKTPAPRRRTAQRPQGAVRRDA